MEPSGVNTAYESLRARWKPLSADERTVLLDRFKVEYSFNSGYMENPAITLHETAEIFDKNGVSNFTGDVRTIFEIANLKHAWSWLMNRFRANTPLNLPLLDAHVLADRLQTLGCCFS